MVGVNCRCNFCLQGLRYSFKTCELEEARSAEAERVATAAKKARNPPRSILKTAKPAGERRDSATPHEHPEDLKKKEKHVAFPHGPVQFFCPEAWEDCHTLCTCPGALCYAAMTDASIRLSAPNHHTPNAHAIKLAVLSALRSKAVIDVVTRRVVALEEELGAETMQVRRLVQANTRANHGRATKAEEKDFWSELRTGAPARDNRRRFEKWVRKQAGLEERTRKVAWDESVSVRAFDCPREGETDEAWRGRMRSPLSWVSGLGKPSAKWHELRPELKRESVGRLKPGAETWYGRKNVLRKRSCPETERRCERAAQKDQAISTETSVKKRIEVMKSVVLGQMRDIQGKVAAAVRREYARSSILT